MANVTDAFNRADSTTTLGTSDSGHAWTTLLTGAWGIATNRGYKSSSGYGIAYVDPGFANGELIVTMPVVTGEFWIVFRLSDGNNYWRFGRASGAYILRTIQANSSVTPVNHNAFNTVTPAGGDRIRIKFEADDSVNCYVTPSGGSEILTSGAGDTFNLSATKHGFAAYHGTSAPPARWDDLTINEIAAAASGSKLFSRNMASIGALLKAGG